METPRNQPLGSSPSSPLEASPLTAASAPAAASPAAAAQAASEERKTYEPATTSLQHATAKQIGQERVELPRRAALRLQLFKTLSPSQAALYNALGQGADAEPKLVSEIVEVLLPRFESSLTDLQKIVWDELKEATPSGQPIIPAPMLPLLPQPVERAPTAGMPSLEPVGGIKTEEKARLLAALKAELEQPPSGLSATEPSQLRSTAGRLQLLDQPFNQVAAGAAAAAASYSGPSLSDLLQVPAMPFRQASLKEEQEQLAHSSMVSRAIAESRMQQLSVQQRLEILARQQGTGGAGRQAVVAFSDEDTRAARDQLGLTWLIDHERPADQTPLDFAKEQVRAINQLREKFKAAYAAKAPQLRSAEDWTTWRTNFTTFLKTSGALTAIQHQGLIYVDTQKQADALGCHPGMPTSHVTISALANIAGLSRADIGFLAEMDVFAYGALTHALAEVPLYRMIVHSIPSPNVNTAWKSLLACVQPVTPHTQQAAEQEFSQLAQRKNESVQQFALRAEALFVKLVQQKLDHSDTSLMLKFLTGINTIEEWRKHAIRYEATTLAGVIQAAIQAEREQKSMSYSNMQPSRADAASHALAAQEQRQSRGKPRPETAICSNCLKQGHFSRNCPNARADGVTVCTYCKKPGHEQLNCRRLKKEQQGNGGAGASSSTAGKAKTEPRKESANLAGAQPAQQVYRNNEEAMVTTDQSESKPLVLLDSGCTTSTAPSSASMHDPVVDRDTAINTACGSRLINPERGTLTVCLGGSELKFNNVLRHSKMKHVLLSVSQMIDQGRADSVVFTKSGAKVLDANGHTVLTATRHNGLYAISPSAAVDQLNSSESHQAEESEAKPAVPSASEVQMLTPAQLAVRRIHERFGHIGSTRLLTLNEQFKLGLSSTDIKNQPPCRVCLEAKAKMRPFNQPGLANAQPGQPLEHVFVDLVGKIVPESAGGNSYLLVMVDVGSRLTHVEPLKSKEGPEVARAIITWVKRMQTRIGRTLGTLHCDRGSEFVNKPLQLFCEENGTSFRPNVPYSPQLQGIVERMNGTILTIMRSSLAQSAAPKELWAEAAVHAAHLHNTTKVWGEKQLTPACYFYSRSEVDPKSLERVHAFASDAYVKMPAAVSGASKLDSPAVKMIYLHPVAGGCSFMYSDGSMRTYDSKHFKILDGEFTAIDNLKIALEEAEEPEQPIATESYRSAARGGASESAQIRLAKRLSKEQAEIDEQKRAEAAADEPEIVPVPVLQPSVDEPIPSPEPPQPSPESSKPAIPIQRSRPPPRARSAPAIVSGSPVAGRTRTQRPVVTPPPAPPAPSAPPPPPAASASSSPPPALRERHRYGLRASPKQFVAYATNLVYTTSLDELGELENELTEAVFPGGRSAPDDAYPSGSDSESEQEDEALSDVEEGDEEEDALAAQSPERRPLGSRAASSRAARLLAQFQPAAHEPEQPARRSNQPLRAEEVGGQPIPGSRIARIQELARAAQAQGAPPAEQLNEADWDEEAALRQGYSYKRMPPEDHPGCNRRGEIQCPSERCCGRTMIGRRCRLRTRNGILCFHHLKRVHNVMIKRSLIPGAGRGIIAAGNIAAEKNVVPYTGILMIGAPTEAATKELEQATHGSVYIMSPARGKVVDAAPTNSAPGRLMNDPAGSRKLPNCKFVVVQSADRQTVKLRTLRNICAGEELTVAYGDKYWFRVNGRKTPATSGEKALLPAASAPRKCPPPAGRQPRKQAAGPAVAPAEPLAEQPAQLGPPPRIRMPPPPEERMEQPPVRSMPSRAQIEQRAQQIMRTRAQAQAQRAGDVDVNAVEEQAIVPEPQAPRSFADVQRSPNRSHWLKAMEKERQALISMHVYDEVGSVPAGAKVMATQHVYRVKLDASGQPASCKARLVARGDHQRPGIDFEDTFAPTAAFASIKIVLALVTHCDLELGQLDVTSAYLHADIDRPLYLQVPVGYKVAAGTIALKLKKALYGLAQAGNLWNTTLVKALTELGWRQILHADECIFTHSASGGRLIILVLYVDDMLYIYHAHDLDLMNELKQQIGVRFNIKDLGEAKSILGLSITRDRAAKTMLVNQLNYTKQLLAQLGFSECKTQSTPERASPYQPEQEELAHKTAPSDGQGVHLKNVAQAVGALQWLAQITRVDICHAVNIVARQVSDPTIVTLMQIKHILRYLAAHPALGLNYHSIPDQHTLQLTAFSDSDHAGDAEDTR